MLGKLTRWLRMLGIDVEYIGSMDDRTLIYKAKQEKRILLTRDLELYRQAMASNVDAFLIKSTDGAANLATLARRFKFELEINAKVSRCPKCNTRIKPILKARVLDKIPKTTASNYDQFWQCPNCRQIYWQGAHWRKIEETLKNARDKI